MDEDCLDEVMRANINSVFPTAKHVFPCFARLASEEACCVTGANLDINGGAYFAQRRTA